MGVKRSYKPISSDDHIARGSCCGNGCQNCPYRPKHTKGSQIIDIVYKTTGSRMFIKKDLYL